MSQNYVSMFWKRIGCRWECYGRVDWSHQSLSPPPPPQLLLLLLLLLLLSYLLSLSLFCFVLFRSISWICCRRGLEMGFAGGLQVTWKLIDVIWKNDSAVVVLLLVVPLGAGFSLTYKWHSKRAAFYQSNCRAVLVLLPVGSKFGPCQCVSTSARFSDPRPRRPASP